MVFKFFLQVNMDGAWWELDSYEYYLEAKQACLAQAKWAKYLYDTRVVDFKNQQWYFVSARRDKVNWLECGF
jgi:hypothetical protein